MDNGGNAAFNPIAEISELEALARAKEVYMKEVRVGKNSEEDKQDAVQQAYRTYQTTGGQCKEQKLISNAMDLYLEEKIFNTVVEK